MTRVDSTLTGAFPILPQRLVDRLFAVFTAVVIALLLLPLVAILALSLYPDGWSQLTSSPTLDAYGAIVNDGPLLAGISLSVQLAFVTALVTTPIAFLAAAGTRKAARRSALIGFFLLPVFMPGISVGFALIVYFQLIGISLSEVTIVLGHVLWTFPFAYIIILTSMASFDSHLKEAAYDLGASEWRAFVDVEYPHIKPGLIGAAIFSFTLSFNEFARTTLVRGPMDTLPTFILGRVDTRGLDETVFAVSGLTIILTTVLLMLFGYFLWRATKQ